MKKFIRNNLWPIIGAISGGFVGYFYWRDMGCSTGNCPITSKPENSIIYFSVLGYLMIGTIAKARTKSEELIVKSEE